MAFFPTLSSISPPIGIQISVLRVSAPLYPSRIKNRMDTYAKLTTE